MYAHIENLCVLDKFINWDNLPRQIMLRWFLSTMTGQKILTSDHNAVNGKTIGSCGQSYKHFVIINYDSRVVPDLKLPHITTLEL